MIVPVKSTSQATREYRVAVIPAEGFCIWIKAASEVAACEQALEFWYGEQIDKFYHPFRNVDDVVSFDEREVQS